MPNGGQFGKGSQGDFLSMLQLPEIPVAGASVAMLGRMHACAAVLGNFTLTLPPAAGNEGRMVGIRVTHASGFLVTVKGNLLELIDGENLRIMRNDEVATLMCDGTGWEKVSGKTIPMASSLGMSANQTFLNSTFTLLTLTVSKYNDAPAAFQDAPNSKFICLRPGLYNVKLAGILSGTNLSANYADAVLYKNGALAALSSHYNAASSNAGILCDTPFKLKVGDFMQPYGWYGVGNYVTTFLLNDVAAQLYNFFTISEEPGW